MFDLTGFVSIDESESLVNLKLFPNPAANYCQIELGPDMQLTRVSVIDMSGKIVLTLTEPNINLREIPSGQYLVEIETDKGITTRKLSVE